MDAQKFNRLIRKIKYDKKAVDLIYDEFSSKLKVHIQRRFGNLVSSEDVVEDIFMKLLEMETPKDVRCPRAWLFRLADNFVTDILRSTHRDEDYIEAVPEEFDIEKVILDIEVKEALSQLDTLTQRIVYMHFWEGYSLKELAIELKLNYPNIRSRVSRSYKILKNFL